MATRLSPSSPSPSISALSCCCPPARASTASSARWKKPAVKGDLVGAAIGTGGGTLVGAVFSHVARGFGFGLAGSAVYVVARKGKDLELPAQTGMLVRMDNTITVPVTSATSASLTSSR